MALVLKDRVKETTTTTGTGTYTLAGAVSGFEAFSEIGNSNTTYYCCTDGTDFEVGIGTYTASGTTLARTTILQSSNSDAAVNWTSGTRTIFCTQPAEKAVFLDANGDATIGGGLTVTGGSSGDTLLKFAMDRSWQFQQSGDDASTRLQLKANVASKSFDIVNSDGDSNFQFNTSATSPTLTLAEDASIIFEGATNDVHETTFVAADPTADRTITLPDATGTVQLTDGSGASLTSLNASQLSSGTVPNARLDQQLQDVAGLAVTNGNFIVGDGSNFVAESGSTARTSLGLGTAAVLDTGISNTNVPKFTSGVADNDFLRVDGTAIEGRSASQVLSDIGAATSAQGTKADSALQDLSDDTSPTLGGALSTGGNQIQLTQTSGNAIVTTGGLSNADLGVLRASAGTGGSDTHGFTIKYMGSRTGNNNSYSLFMDNQTGTDVEAITVLQDGKVGILNTSPGSALDVTGEIAATSLDISGDVDVDGTLEADAMTLNGTAITATATLSTGISNNNVPKFTSGVADNDFLRVDGTAIEGRSASEVLSDIAAMPLAGGTFTGDVTLTDTDSGSAEGPLLILNRDSGSPANNDVLGHIKFKGDNDAGENVFYAGINAKINDDTDGTEDGLLDLSVMANGTVAASRIRIQGNGDTVISNRDVRLNIGVDLKFEGATSNDHETTLTVTDPTADRTITLPDATGTVQLTDGSGASLTSLNASELGSGTVPNARLDAQLQDVAGLAVTNGGFIVGDGSNFVLETGATARTSLGLGTAAVAATGISNGNVPVFTSGVADNDFLRVNGTSIEGRSASELASDIGASTTDEATALAIALG